MFLVGDVGTAGTTVAIIDVNGKCLADFYREHPLYTPKPYHAEEEPEDWWNSIIIGIRQVIARANVNPKDIMACCFSGLAPDVVAVDRKGTPLRPAIIWLDRRALAECEELTRTIGREEIQRLSGNVPDPYYGFPKMMWLQRNEARIFEKTYKILQAKDYIVCKLTGEFVVDYSYAGLISTVFDIRRKRWDESFLDAVKFPVEKLPDLKPCDEVIGEISEEAARLTGLKAGIPVVAGAFDGASSALGSGVVNDGESCFMYGTSGCWFIVQSTPRFDGRFINVPYAAYSHEKYSPFGGMATCGAILRWFRDNFAQLERFAADDLGISPYQIMDLEAAKVPVGSDKLVILPYFMGERSPIWDPHARGVIFGLSLRHTRGHIIRAAMEATGHALYHHIEIVRELGIPFKEEIIAVNGGARSRVWRQILTDVTGIPQSYAPQTLGAVTGDALIAGVGIGELKYEIIKEWVPIVERHKVDPENHLRYMEYYELYRKLYEHLREDFRVLKGIT